MSGDAPVLSVVMPTRNQAAFIGESVRSVLSQGIERLELVIADGASTDGTPAILHALEKAHPGTISWYSAPDDGPADAVNRAVARARGAVIGWLNSDDLYTPGAAAAALTHLHRHAGHVMVYGEGEHIDDRGNVLGRYPSRAPDIAAAAFADGCPVCQPTAFLRRDTFLALGGLDTTLATAFDFDFWMRLWQAAPGAVGFLPRVQAQTRLHAAAITVRMRETVALEGLEVLHRHTGRAPPHWLRTYFQELKAMHPFGTAHPVDLGQELRAVVQRATRWLAAADIVELEAAIASDRAVALASPHWYAAVDSDGCAGPHLEIRVRQAAVPARALRIHARSVAPRWGRLRLSVVDSEGRTLQEATIWRRRFQLDVPLPEHAPDAALRLHVRSQDSYVPADHERGSTDRRALAFAIDRIEPVFAR